MSFVNSWNLEMSLKQNLIFQVICEEHLAFMLKFLESCAVIHNNKKTLNDFVKF